MNLKKGILEVKEEIDNKKELGSLSEVLISEIRVKANLASVAMKQKRPWGQMAKLKWLK